MSRAPSVAGTAREALPNHAFMLSRRWAWLSSTVETSNMPPVPPEMDYTASNAGVNGLAAVIQPGLLVGATSAMPTTLGGGTEDAVVLVPPRDVPYTSAR